MATISDIFIDQGTDYSSIITIAGVDLTNYTIESQIRKGYGSTTATSFTATIPPATAADGKIKLELSAATSSGMKAGRYVYDVELTAPSGAKSRPLKGLVILDPEVTR